MGVMTSRYNYYHDTRYLKDLTRACEYAQHLVNTEIDIPMTMAAIRASNMFKVRYNEIYDYLWNKIPDDLQWECTCLSRQYYDAIRYDYT